MSQKKVGFLLIHGFTGTHYELEPLAEFLRKQGYVVENITLPGHETTPEDHLNTKWTEILDYAQQELDKLKTSCETVFVSGLSMGGAITLYLGAKNPSLAGIIPMSAPYKIPDWRFTFLKLFPFLFILMPWQYNDNSEIEDPKVKEIHRCYERYRTRSVLWLNKLLKEARNLLPVIKVPTLILHSVNDPSVPQKHAKYIFNKIKARDKELIWIEKGGHIIPEDYGKEQAFSVINSWVEERIE
ncbi:MAG: alpha/beta hydrolase [Candidatus Heimdallarchaeaceae archaeon]